MTKFDQRHLTTITLGSAIDSGQFVGTGANVLIPSTLATSPALPALRMQDEMATITFPTITSCR